MKISALTFIAYFVGIYLSLSNGKSIKSYYGNSISHMKGERKPLASPMGNAIHNANYQRAKRQIPPAMLEFQQVLNNAKMECVREMNVNPSVLKKSLMYEEYPTAEEKCVMMCILKKTKLMEDSNKVSLKTIARIAGSISDNNALVVSVAEATANKCNSLLRAQDPCETASEINKCIANELKTHKLKFYY